jgi:hypothetical protein
VPFRPDAPCLRRIALASAGASISNFSAEALSGPDQVDDWLSVSARFSARAQ